LGTALNNLGEVLRSQGKLTEAEAAFTESLEIRNVVFGQHHPQVAQSLSNLGYVLLLQHRLETAQGMFEQALEMRESALGVVHPHRVSSLALLGQTLAYQRQFEAARERLSQAVEVAEQVYGAQHSQPAHLMCRLARVELQLGRKARAELLLLKAKAILEKEVGPNHRFFAEALLGLGEIYQRERKWEQAFPLLERTLAILRQTMQGPRFEIGETLLMLGENLHARGVSKEAHVRLLECYRIWSALLDERDPHYMACAALLGELSIQHGDAHQAEMLLDQALADAERRSSSEQLDKLIPLLADARAKLGKYSEAEEMLQRQYARLAQPQAGAERAQLNVLSHLAGVKVLRQDFSAAVPVIEQCIQLAETVFGPAHEETAKHLDNLAGVYFLQEKFVEAEPLIGRAVQIFQNRLGLQHAATQAAMTNYSRLLKKLNRESQADAVAETVQEAQELQSHVLDDLF
jgi:tetratricopeptide (TPR) repeat protein